MPNVYGTKEYEEYIANYRKTMGEYEFSETDEYRENFEANGIKIDFASRAHTLYKNKDDEFPTFSLETGEITVTLKDGCAKTYETVEDFLKPQVFSVNGTDYIFIRKALYGYCIIDARNFEEYNYFPSAVLRENGEAFISCDVTCFKDLLIIDGCYWGAPYELYVMDFESRKSVRLAEFFGFSTWDDFVAAEGALKVCENGFYVTNEIDGKEYFAGYDELKKRIEKEGSFDI